MSKDRIRSPIWLWLVALAAIAFALGAVPSVARAAGPAAPLDCSAIPVTPGPVTLSGWIGGDMDVTLTPTGCGSAVSGHVTVANGVGTLSFDSGATMLPGVSYNVSGTATISGTLPGICAIWSLTCTIAPGTTFSIDATSGQETINGAISCQGTVQFTGTGLSLEIDPGTSPITGNGQDPPGPTATPELSSSALVATGLIPTLLIVYRRRRNRRRDDEES